MRKPSSDSPKPESHWLDPQDFQYLCFDFTRKFLTMNEPIPDYSTRENALLESALGCPRQTFDGKYLYPTLAKQGSILFYALIKNHPFKNGNKRIAVISLLAFLSLNDKWLTISPLALYRTAKRVAASDPYEKTSILKNLNRQIGRYLIVF